MGWEWSYCRHPGCDRGLARATLREVTDDVQYCADGHENQPNVTRDEALLDLADRVERLEEQLRICTCSSTGPL